MEITNLTLELGQRLIFDSLSLELAEGRINLLIGPNGAGKTTLIRWLSGELEANRGEVNIAGRPVALGSDEWKARTGTVPDSDALFAELSVREHLELAGTLFGVDTAELDRRIESLLAYSGLDDKSDLLGSELSAGMRKRLALSISLIHAPQYFLFDEPLTTLDYANSENFFMLLDFLRSRERTVLVTGHSVPRLLEAADRVLVMEDGRLIEVTEVTPQSRRQVLDRLAAQAASISKKNLGKQLDWFDP